MTMKQAIKKHKELGRHFFDKDAMDFFNSEIESKLFDDKYFITSERMEYDWPKKYTIREFDNDFLDVNDVSDFQEFDSLEDAMEALYKIIWEEKYV